MAESSEKQGPSSRIGGGLTVLAGAVLVAVLVPVMQWIDIGTIGNSAETDVPNPVAIGVLMGLAAINGAAYLAARRRLLPPRTLLVLYAMLTVSLPLCSTGLVHGFYSSLTGVQGEHLDRRIPTIGPAYNQYQKPAFYPKLPAEQYERWVWLKDADRAKAEGVEDPAGERSDILNPFKRFWSGANLMPRYKEQYENPEWTTADRVAASWKAVWWSIWRPPLLAWGVFFLLVLLGLMCLAQILHRDWTQRENLPFPVAQLPLAILGGSDSSAAGQSRTRGLSSPFFWGAAAVSALLVLLGGMQHYELLRLEPGQAVTFQRIDFQAIFLRPPWSILKRNVLLFSPLMIGLSLLVHKDVLRGVVIVFLALMGLRLVVGLFETGISQALGPQWDGNQMPYFPELATGAVIVFAIWMVWRSRGALFPQRGDAVGETDAGETVSSYLPRRWAAPGLLVSVLGIAVFWYLCGARGIGGLYVVGIVLLFTLLAGVALARVRAEGGLPAGSTPLVNDMTIGVNTGGVGTHGFHNLVALSHTWFLAVAFLPGVLAAQIEALYLGRKLKVSPRLIAVAVAVAFGVAVGVGTISFLVLAHWKGAQHLMIALDRGKYSYWFKIFNTGDPMVDKFDVRVLWVCMILLGGVLMAGLLALRRRYPRFPIPPIALLIVCLGTYTLHRDVSYSGLYAGVRQINPICFIWGPMLIAWIVKSLILRFGGMDLYVRFIPAALGLIFGHAAMIVFWNVYHLFWAPAGRAVFTGVFL